MGMKFIYYLLWPLMLIASLLGGIVVGLIGITIGHFQDMALTLRRENMEYAKYYDYKKAEYQTALWRQGKRSLVDVDDPSPPPKLIACLMIVYFLVVMYPLVLLRYIVVAPSRAFSFMNIRLRKWARLEA